MTIDERAIHSKGHSLLIHLASLIRTLNGTVQFLAPSVTVDVFVNEELAVRTKLFHTLNR